MALYPSLRRFPLDSVLKDKCGFPWGCVVQPLYIPSGQDDPEPVESRNVARCVHCYAWISRACTFETTGWLCALCTNHNDYGEFRARYASPSRRYILPELRGGVVELIAPEDEEEHGALATQLGHPICLALVDASGSSDFLSVVQSALEAAVDAMPEGALLGVVTFSSSAGLYALAPASERPAARFVSLSIDDTATSPPSAVAFEDALALEHVLMTTGSGDSADRVRRLLDAVFTAIASNATPATASSAPVRAFGPALQAALRYLAEGAGPVLSSLHAKHGGQRGRTADPAAQGAVSFAGAQLLCFLSGPPNVGRGRTVGEDAGPKGGGKQGVTERARVFYSEAAIAAAALGVSVDVFAVAEDEEEIGLDCLEAATSSSGGSVFLYPSLSGCGLPQDVTKRVTAFRGLNGLLRVRTTPEFEVAEGFGRLFQDEQFDDLYHVVSCNETASYALDFKYAGPDGFRNFSQSGIGAPAVQVAFSYTTIVPVEVPRRPNGVPDSANETSQSGRGAGAGILRAMESMKSDGSSSGGPPEEDMRALFMEARRSVEGDPRELESEEESVSFLGTGAYQLERRIRINTVRFDIAHRPTDVYKDMDPDVVLALLMHKATKAASVEGIEDARDLLADWLVNCVSRYTINMYEREGELIPEDFGPDDVLARMDLYTQLEVVPRLLYALLRSPLLPALTPAAARLRQKAHEMRMPAVTGPMGSTAEDDSDGASGSARYQLHHPDMRPFVKSLWSSLPPHELTRAIYPVLESWSSLSEVQHDRLILSRETVEEEQEEVGVLVLDSFYSIMVVYTDMGTLGIPWPLPPDSPLSRSVQATKIRRSLTPRVELRPSGTRPTDDEEFSKLLIEEAAQGWDGEAEGKSLAEAAMGGYKTFVSVLQKEAAAYIRSGDAWA